MSVQPPLGCYELPGAAQPSPVRPAPDVSALGMVFNLEAQYDGFGVGGLQVTIHSGGASADP
ncbi:MAG TPA: hypothetical protein VEP50_07935 [bacterium]|nr:hypothetical protein [bacterium]